MKSPVTKILYRRLVPLLVAALCLCAATGVSLGQEHETEKQYHPKLRILGEDTVQWENEWYPLSDGADGKILARRGRVNGQLWIQFRNDYDQGVSFRALVIFTLTSGGKSNMLIYQDLGLAETQALPVGVGEEITKVDVDNFKLVAPEEKAKPKK